MNECVFYTCGLSLYNLFLNTSAFIRAKSICNVKYAMLLSFSPILRKIV